MIIVAENQAEVERAKVKYLSAAEKIYKDYHLTLSEKIERIAVLFDEYNCSLGL